MKKTTLIGLVVTLLLVVGAIFVSAHLATDEVSEDSEPEVTQPEKQTCSPGTCNFQCGGNCGIPSCGCGR